MRFVKEAFDSNYIAPLGPQVDAFEKEFAEYVGLRHCLALSSGTAAMHLALINEGVGPEDEVFASTLTFIGSVTPITFLGAVPVFIDADRSTWNMNPDLLAEELEACSKSGRLPKAVIPTDLYGQCCNYDRIFEICDRYGVPVVVDAAEALGAVYYSTNVKLKMLNSELRKKPNNKVEKGERPHTDQFKAQNSKLKTPVHAGKGAAAFAKGFRLRQGYAQTRRREREERAKSQKAEGRGKLFLSHTKGKEVGNEGERENFRFHQENGCS